MTFDRRGDNSDGQFEINVPSTKIDDLFGRRAASEAALYWNQTPEALSQSLMEAVCGGALSDIGDARDCETWNLENGSLLGGGGGRKGKTERN